MSLTYFLMYALTTLICNTQLQHSYVKLCTSRVITVKMHLLRFAWSSNICWILPCMCVHVCVPAAWNSQAM